MFERLVKEVIEDKYKMCILKELRKVSPYGFAIEELKEKTNLRGRGKFFEALKFLENNGLIKVERAGKKGKPRQKYVTINDVGTMILSKAEAEQEARPREIIKRHYGFHVGSDGVCKTTFFFPFGSSVAKEHVGNKMAPFVEKLLEKLLSESVYLIQRNERLQASVLVDVDTHDINEDIFSFRENLFALKKEMDTVEQAWHERWDEVTATERQLLGSSAFIFEATLTRKELEKRGVDVYSPKKIIEIKRHLLTEGFKNQQIFSNYEPDFRFLINNKVVDLSQTEPVQAFFENLRDKDIAEWIRRNRNKDGTLDGWFGFIPWNALGFPGNDNAETEFVECEEDDSERFLLWQIPPKPEMHPHLRFVLHMLKRTPLDIGTERWLKEVRDNVEMMERLLERTRNSLNLEDINDYILLSTYENVKYELGQPELPIDLKNSVGFYGYFELGILPPEIDPSWKVVFQHMFTQKPKQNPLVDDFLDDKWKEWREQKKPRESWKTCKIFQVLARLYEDYRKLISEGVKRDKALRTAVNNHTNVSVYYGERTVEDNSLD